MPTTSGSMAFGGSGAWSSANPRPPSSTLTDKGAALSDPLREGLDVDVVVADGDMVSSGRSTSILSSFSSFDRLRSSSSLCFRLAASIACSSLALTLTIHASSRPLIRSSTLRSWTKVGNEAMSWHSIQMSYAPGLSAVGASKSYCVSVVLDFVLRCAGDMIGEAAVGVGGSAGMGTSPVFPS